ncbi:AAA family ATPase [Candidatus Sulfurimonas marisnigri]|uniref:AAA family ATPase n=1 Tax=Candidatus Sulfurimonas marisnigri TaxID=2740405 RepID=A0A7S7RRF6_9BACT|nr:AAA family ATPase [Candidatus Sulfurimonas marisnigri]QOY55709.1 AAA family ATPase [Candidatus Sulfurimonas marisnigri]
MKIKSVKISNFRSIIDVEISFENLMMFIGQNNHGKSNILYAILFFFGEIKIQDLDFFDGTDDLYVEILFYDLDDDDKVTFNKYLTIENEILVRKTAYRNGSFEYNGYIQNPQNEYLQESNATNYRSRETALELPFYDYLPPDGRLTIALIQDAQQQYIADNGESIEFVYELEETNFLGAKNVAQGMFGEIFFIPAVKSINEDLSSNKTSVFTKLYSKVIELVTSSNADISSIKTQINTQFNKFKKYNEDSTDNQDRPVELNEFENRLSHNLREWGVNLEVEILPPNIDDVFKSDVNIWIHDGIKTDINRKGHGLQRAMTFSLIKTFSEHVLSIPDEERPNRQASKSSYFIFEEPELYLHPQAQRALLDTLINLSNDSQVILCTHSSSLISLDNYKSIAIVRKDATTNETSITQYQDEIFVGDEKKNFNLLSWVNPDRAELFFAKKVILVEGATEKAIVPFIAKKLNVFKFEYTLINCGSKTNIPYYINLLNKFKIPYFAVYDKDHQSSKQEQARNVADRDTAKIEDIIDSSIGKGIVFINDIEEELGMTAGISSKPFTALEEISKEEFIVSTSLETKIIEIFS